MLSRFLQWLKSFFGSNKKFAVPDVPNSKIWVVMPLTYEKWKHPSTKAKHYRAVFSNGLVRRTGKQKFKTATQVLAFVDRYTGRMCEIYKQRRGL